jgi:hypothetical protein
MVFRRTALWLVVAIITVSAAFLAWHLIRAHVASPTIQGAVIRRDADPRKELPISGATITVSDGTASNGQLSETAESDPSGYFRIVLPKRMWLSKSLRIVVTHAEYQPLEMTASTNPALPNAMIGRLFIAAMTPVATPSNISLESGAAKEVVISNISIRYTTNSQELVNIGSAVRTFQVANAGNIPCGGKPPCSPDGKWKATAGTEEMDAGAGNRFGNARASCIAGPCPFTRIEESGFTRGGRTIHATALNWSDTATFLLEAEVFQTTINSDVRESYPVIFGKVINFTLPPTEEGASIEAEIDGSPMVFPLGPDLNLSWANCKARDNANEDKSTVYRCELKPGYRF